MIGAALFPVANGLLIPLGEYITCDDEARFINTNNRIEIKDKAKSRPSHRKTTRLEINPVSAAY